MILLIHPVTEEFEVRLYLYKLKNNYLFILSIVKTGYFHFLKQTKVTALHFFIAICCISLLGGCLFLSNLSDKKEDSPIKTHSSSSIKLPPLLVEHWVSFQVRSGDSITSLFKKAGLTPANVQEVIRFKNAKKVLSHIYPGETILLLIKNNVLVKLRLNHSALKSTLLVKTDDGWNISTLEKKPVVKQVTAKGVIEDSLFLAGEDAGMSNKKIMELANLFGWDLDFVMDIRKGDSFKLIYDNYLIGGKKVGEGPIIAAQFINRGKKYYIFRYTDSENHTGYYTDEGYNAKRTFIRTPVAFSRISSKFSYGRRHPILNRIRAHRGVDYAAPSGTAIKASGDGRIIFRGKKKDYGNTIIIRHGNNISTLYAHMRSFKKGLKKGSKVAQSQVIGFVGQTGLATGPHLHYEFRLNGIHRDPLTVKLPKAEPIKESERARFLLTIAPLLIKLQSEQATPDLDITE